MTIQALRELRTNIQNKTIPAEYSNMGASLDDMRKAYLNGIRELAKDFNSFRRNKYDIFEIMQEDLDTIMPQRVLPVLSMFCDVQQVADGQKVTFRRKKGKNRAKSFITKAAVAGVYETFRLDSETFDLPITAIGGAYQIDFNRFACGLEDLADYQDALFEGIEDSIYNEVMAALKNAESHLPAANVGADASSAFSAAGMVDVINAVKAYSSSVVIIATTRFIQHMGADVITTGTVSKQIPLDLEEIKNYGTVQTFRGTPIIEIKNSFTDETNTAWTLDDNYAFVMPAGGEKVVKLGFEGNTIVEDWKNRDLSMEIQAYKKFGVGIVTYNNWGIYKASGL